MKNVNLLFGKLILKNLCLWMSISQSNILIRVLIANQIIQKQAEQRIWSWSSDEKPFLIYFRLFVEIILYLKLT